MNLLALFAQRGGNDSLIFRVIMIPLGVFLAFIGVLAVRQQRIYLRKWGITLTGIPAVILGGILAFLGIGIVLIMFASFFGLTNT